MAFRNIGVGPTPPRRGAPPPPFGGGSKSGPPQRAKPAVAIIASPGGGPQEDEPEPAGPGAGQRPPARTAPAAGGESIPPEAVSYRSEMETCGQCAYNAGGECSKLHIPVGDGDGCNLFKDNNGGGDADRAADQFEQGGDEGAGLE